MYKFELHSGTASPSTRKSLKFLAFLIHDRMEIPTWTARKQGFLDRVTIGAKSQYEYETEVHILKIFVSEVVFGKPGLKYSFYINLLTPDQSPQEITLKPYDDQHPGWYFKGQGRFMKDSEVRQYLDPDGMSAKMLGRATISPDILKRMITIAQPKVIEQASRVRRIRINNQTN